MPKTMLALALLTPLAIGAQQRPAQFRIEETTIADIHAAFKAKTLTCHALVQQYLIRIDAIDKKGPAINAIILTNPNALAVADSLDRRYAQPGPTGHLPCPPIILAGLLH